MRNWHEQIRQRLRGLNLSPTREREIVDELAQHLQDRYEELRAGGAADDVAFRDAMAELEVPFDSLVQSTLKGELAQGGPGFLASRLSEAEQPMNPEPIVVGTHGSSFVATLGHFVFAGTPMDRLIPLTLFGVGLSGLGRCLDLRGRTAVGRAGGRRGWRGVGHRSHE